MSGVVVFFVDFVLGGGTGETEASSAELNTDFIETESSEATFFENERRDEEEEAEAAAAAKEEADEEEEEKEAEVEEFVTKLRIELAIEFLLERFGVSAIEFRFDDEISPIEFRVDDKKSPIEFRVEVGISSLSESIRSDRILSVRK